MPRVVLGVRVGFPDEPVPDARVGELADGLLGDSCRHGSTEQVSDVAWARPAFILVFPMAFPLRETDGSSGSSPQPRGDDGIRVRELR